MCSAHVHVCLVPRRIIENLTGGGGVVGANATHGSAWMMPHSVASVYSPSAVCNRRSPRPVIARATSWPACTTSRTYPALTKRAR